MKQHQMHGMPGVSVDLWTHRTREPALLRRHAGLPPREAPRRTDELLEEFDLVLVIEKGRQLLGTSMDELRADDGSPTATMRRLLRADVRRGAAAVIGLVTAVHRVGGIARRDALVELSHRYRLLLSFASTLAAASRRRSRAAARHGRARS